MGQSPRDGTRKSHDRHLHIPHGRLGSLRRNIQHTQTSIWFNRPVVLVMSSGEGRRRRLRGRQLGPILQNAGLTPWIEIRLTKLGLVFCLRTFIDRI